MRTAQEVSTAGGAPIASGFGLFANNRQCYEAKDTFLPHLERTVPYVLRLPWPLSAAQLQIVGKRCREVVHRQTNDSRIHFIGVASRGIPMATAATLAYPDASDVFLSHTGKNASVDHVARPTGCFTVVVDNSVASGRTARAVVGALASIGIRPDLLVTFFDREELTESGTDPIMETALQIGCPIQSLFSFRDLVQYEQRPEVRAILLDHASNFGTDSLRGFLRCGRLATDKTEPSSRLAATQ
jgi:orotate phosphoribosyltransferase